MLYFIPLIIAGVSFLIILIIVVRHSSDIKLLDPGTLDEEKESQVKKRIVADRLSRRAVDVRKQFSAFAKPATHQVKQTFKNFHDKVLELDKEMNRQKKIAEKKGETKPVSLQGQAQKHMQEQKFKEAEDLFIELIKRDTKNLLAYQSIADIYISTKDYQKAEETLQYIEKILKNKKDNRNLALCYEKFGSVYELQGKKKIAMEYYKKAVLLEPKNPKYLDLLLKISIILKDKKLASDTLNSLKEADSDNKKIKDFEKEINSL